MTPLALPKLPDRVAAKRTISCDPELNRALEIYALLYRETYGQTETVETLIPFMLAAFLAKDRTFAAFRKTRRGLPEASLEHPPRPRRGRRPKAGAGTGGSAAL